MWPEGLREKIPEKYTPEKFRQEHPNIIIRILKPNQLITMDYCAKRANLIIGEDGYVKKIYYS